MQSLDDKLFYLQSISKDLNTQLLTLIALRESTNVVDARSSDYYIGRSRSCGADARIRLNWTRHRLVLAGPRE
jgi:hypothetical protein